MKVEFLEVAEIELDDARDYYEDQLPGLGSEFVNEVINCLSRISDHPTAWSEIAPDIRRALTHRFPYGLIYTIENDLLLVISVANTHRKPMFWQDRIDS